MRAETSTPAGGLTESFQDGITPQQRDVRDERMLGKEVGKSTPGKGNTEHRPGTQRSTEHLQSQADQ